MFAAAVLVRVCIGLLSALAVPAAVALPATVSVAVARAAPVPEAAAPAAAVQAAPMAEAVAPAVAGAAPLAAAGRAAARGVPARPPQQPRRGPGGAAARHGRVIGSVHGEGERQFWLFEPAEPAPESAPVVVLLHGWGAMVPWPYGAWIDHLVRRGYIIIYPRYQASLLTVPVHMTEHAAAAVRAALALLQQGSHVRPALDRVAFVGHSLGGVLAANLAAQARARGLSVPRALMVVQPGDPPRSLLNIGRGQPSIMADYRAIDPETLMLVVVGDRDATVGQETARAIFYGASRVPPENKDFVAILSDWHGRPPLVADHYLPTAIAPAPGATELLLPGENLPGRWATWALVRTLGILTGQVRPEQRLKPPDALDFYGTWKLLDGLLEAAFYGRHRRFALGDTPEQRFMGFWSDGVPVRELQVTDRP